MKTLDNVTINVKVTRGIEGRQPDIWLQLGADLIARLTTNEALELARILLTEVIHAED